MQTVPALCHNAGQKVDHLKSTVILGGCIFHPNTGVT